MTTTHFRIPLFAVHNKSHLKSCETIFSIYFFLFMEIKFLDISVEIYQIVN